MMRYLLVLFFLLFNSNVFAVVNGQNGYVGSEIDVRAYELACDNSATTDGTKLTEAISSLNAAGGGVLVFPANKTCIVSGDVTLLSRVNLKGLPGAKIKVNSGGTFTAGVLVGSSISNVKIEGLTIDLQGLNKPAIKTTGEDIVIDKNYIYNGDTSEASNWSLVDWGCGTNGSSPASSVCSFTNNRIECANTSGSKDIGLTTSGSTDDGQLQYITNNQIVGCESYGITTSAISKILNNGIVATNNGIVSTAIETSVQNNRVKVSGSTAIGIGLSGARSSATANKISTTGSAGIGISTSSQSVSVVSNALVIAGKSGIAIKTLGSLSTIVGNSYVLSSNDAGTDDAVGLYIGDSSGFVWGWAISGNSGNITTTDSQSHIVIATNQVSITGNYFFGGKYCIVPSQASYAEFSAAYNVNITGNRCYGQTQTAIIAKTGYIITGNYLAWLGTTGTAVIEVGDNRTYKGLPVHLNIVSNLIHTTPNSTASGILFNGPGKLCSAGSLQGQSCTVDGDCTGGGAGSCSAAPLGANIQITGNHLYLASSNHGPSIDFDNGIDGSSGGYLNVIISGNSFNTAVTQSTSQSAIKCNSTYFYKLSNIFIGENSYIGYTPVTGDASDGRLDMNCTPDIVKDSDTTMLWLPAAGCNQGTGYPVFDLPSSSPAGVICNGTNQPRGFLSFVDGSDTTSYVSFGLPGTTSTYQFFVRPVYAVNASNNLYTRWAFTARCSGNDDPVDSSWTETEYNLDTNYGSVGAMDFRAISGASGASNAFTTMNYFACAKDMVTLRVRRIGSNSTATQDDQTNTSYLLGLQVYIRKQT